MTDPSTPEADGESNTCPELDLTSAYNPFDEPQRSDPFDIWAYSRQHCPVFRSDTLGAWVVTPFDEVTTALNDHETFSNAGANQGFSTFTPEAKAILDSLPQADEMDILVSDPPRHSKLRQFMQTAFIPRRVELIRPHMEAFANRLVDEILQKLHSPFDFYTEFAYPYPLSVVASLVGIPEADVPLVRRLAEHNMRLKWQRVDSSEQVALAEGRREWFGYIEGLLERRRAKPGDDFVSALIAHSDASEDPLTGPELIGQVATMVSAGHETTANYLTLLLHTLLETRTLWEAVVADPETIPDVVEEGLRLQGPVRSLWRTTTCEVDVAGTTIPAGARVTLATGSAGRDAAVFEDPDTFDPSRQGMRRHVAFGRGIHSCAGSNVARAEAQIALRVLASRLPDLRLSPNPEFTFAPSAIQRVPRHLSVAWR